MCENRTKSPVGPCVKEAAAAKLMIVDDRIGNKSSGGPKRSWAVKLRSFRRKTLSGACLEKTMCVRALEFVQSEERPSAESGATARFRDSKSEPAAHRSREIPEPIEAAARGLVARPLHAPRTHAKRIQTSEHESVFDP